MKALSYLYGPTQLRRTLLLRAICIRELESPQSQSRTGTLDRSADTARPAADNTCWRRASFRPATAQLIPGQNTNSTYMQPKIYEHRLTQTAHTLSQDSLA